MHYKKERMIFVTPKMRTIDEAYEYLVESDPETRITRTGLKRLVKTGKIESVAVGRKTLVNLEAVERFFNGSLETAYPAPTTSTVIPENGELVFKLVKEV